MGWRARTLLVVAGLVVAGLPLLVWRPKSDQRAMPIAEQVHRMRSDAEGERPAPPLANPSAPEVNLNGVQAPARDSNMARVKYRASEMTAEEKAKFEAVFTRKIKPAVERWCAVYAEHAPFRPEEVTLDKFKEWIFPGGPGEGYAFVVNGTTVTLDANNGKVVLDYIMAPGAALLWQTPNSAPPPLEGSVTMGEALRLLKADSGRDFPPDQIAMRPTGRSGAMNGGVYVDVGENVKQRTEDAEYSLVFGPDGRLVYYLWNPPPKYRARQRE